MSIIKTQLLLMCCILLGLNSNAQNPTYLLKLANETQPTSNTYEFDVFLLRTGSVPLQLSHLGFGLGIDVIVKNGGTLSASIISGSSELPSGQVPTLATISTTNYTSTTAICGSCDGTGLTYNFMNVSPRPSPGYGNGAIISNIDGGCSHPGTLVARFRITNSQNFALNSKMNIVWSASVGPGRSTTVVSAYFNSSATVITSTANNLNWNSPGTCATNPTLGAVCVSPPTANAGGSYISCSSRQLSGSIGGSATAATWSSPTGGTFTPDANTLNAIYNPSVADFLNGSVVLTLTSDNPNGSPCIPAVNNATLTLATCDDGNICTVDFCDANGVCQHTPVNTDDGNYCTLDACDPVTGIYHTPTPPPAFFIDMDSDGYGHPSVSQSACFQPAGYVINNHDCDDSNPSVHPNASEDCSNTIDDNCDGQINESCPGVTLNLKMFIEGYHTNGNEQKSAMFNEGVSSDTAVCDIITVVLHASTSPFSAVVNRTGLLHNDGSAYINFPSFVNGGSYFIVVKHRNSMETWSKFPVTFSTLNQYDFTQ